MKINDKMGRENKTFYIWLGLAARTLQGTLGSGELRVSGTARMGNALDDQKKYYEAIK